MLVCFCCLTVPSLPAFVLVGVLLTGDPYSQNKFDYIQATLQHVTSTHNHLTRNC